jgi:hypothetical protein
MKIASRDESDRITLMANGSVCPNSSVKRTVFTAPIYDCFAPKSGHLSAWAGREIYEYAP